MPCAVLGYLQLVVWWQTWTNVNPLWPYKFPCLCNDWSRISTLGGCEQSNNCASKLVDQIQPFYLSASFGCSSSGSELCIRWCYCQSAPQQSGASGSPSHGRQCPGFSSKCCNFPLCRCGCLSTCVTARRRYSFSYGLPVSERSAAKKTTWALGHKWYCQGRPA